MNLSREQTVAAVLMLVVVTNLYDLYVDVSHGASRWHIFEEASLIFISTAALLWLAAGWIRQKAELDELRAEIQSGAGKPAELDEDMREARQRLGKAIQAQFEKWSLTGSEREVALLLLKGLSFKEIAAVRTTAEKTVRQQASAIYRKAGVNGRHAFAAWFIEDYL